MQNSVIMQSGGLAPFNWETAIGPCVLWDNAYYRVPSSAVVTHHGRAFVVHPKLRLPSHMDLAFTAVYLQACGIHQIMGRMLVGKEWPKVAREADGIAFSYAHHRFDGQMEVDGPEEYV